MGIRTAADIHTIRIGHRARPVASATDYRAALQQYADAAGTTVTRSFAQPPVYVDGWKWVIVCACENRPAYGWGMAACFGCGVYLEDLVLPEEAEEIERLLSLRPKLAQRSWLPGETLDDLRRENASIGVPS